MAQNSFIQSKIFFLRAFVKSRENFEGTLEKVFKLIRDFACALVSKHTKAIKLTQVAANKFYKKMSNYDQENFDQGTTTQTEKKSFEIYVILLLFLAR